MPAITKMSREDLRDVLLLGKLTWKLLRATKQLEFAIVRIDPRTGEPKRSITHTVDLTENEHKHLDEGGKIVVIHACGYQAHVSV